MVQREVEREKKVRALVNFALEERSEAYRERVTRIILRADIDPEDPMFLVILALGSVEVMLHELPVTLERREAKLNQLVAALEAQYERFKVAADDITVVTKEAETRIKKVIALKLPGDTKPKDHVSIKAAVLAVTFLMGIVLSTPLTQVGTTVSCQLTHTCKKPLRNAP